MDNVVLAGVIVTPLKRIQHPKGHVLHGMKKSDQGFVAFGEAYFSTIGRGQVKGWNKHKRMTVNLIVPVGKVVFVVYDGGEGAAANFMQVELSPDENYCRLTISPGYWFAFQGKQKVNLILNLADMEHDPDEFEKCDLSQIDYKWELT
ncbi:hypothetical protein JY97_01025 [Alkalispirochaeta odontotermitis]|nr:hypothetical protein JY97_01025 [Alkalispirochaeta odontotermitis]CAB1075335.1 hypothetical protein D1AOALGA4SA_3155 [Olavius algarvensis Delta 1 endosymbiont]